MTITPDGGRLTLTGFKGRLLGPWSCMIETTGPQGLVRMHTGNAGSLEATEAFLGDLGKYRIREVQRGHARLVALETSEPALTTFLWQGRHHEISTTVGGTQVPFEVFLGLLDHFEISDTPEGVVLRARPGSGASARFVLAANGIAGVCAVTVRPVDVVRRSLPRHAGRRVPGGVMWQANEQLGGRDIRRAIVANDTAATVMETDRPDDEAFVDVVTSLSIALEPAA